jgi:thiol-disulfide isomerase/thioredoxin
MTEPEVHEPAAIDDRAVRVFAPSMLSILLLLAIGSGCGGGSRTPGEERVGDLSDRSYYDARDEARVSASGENVRFDQFEGRFIWAEYAAPWCASCAKQASAIKQVEDSIGRAVVFLTIVTSDMGGYGDPATRTTAQKWADQHGLEPQRVLAADLTATTIPRHILYSPEGQVLFIATGYLPADRIKEVIEERSSDWKAWSRSGRLASWMRVD